MVREDRCRNRRDRAGVERVSPLRAGHVKHEYGVSVLDGRDLKNVMSDEMNAAVERKTIKLIETAVMEKNPEFNFVMSPSAKWHGGYFYFVASACPKPKIATPTFEATFAKSEHTAIGSVQRKRPVKCKRPVK